MRSLLVVLALALAACGGKTKSSTLGSTLPTGPAAQGPVTADALKAYFTARFPAAIKEGVLTADFGSGGVDDDVVKELGIMGVTDMRDLPALVPADFDTKGFGAIKASSKGMATRFREAM